MSDAKSDAPLPPLTVIATVKSPFREKFGIPRQPGILADIESDLIFKSPFGNADAFRGLDGFSHLWVSFIFHAVKQDTFTPLVRPPRLGGNTKVGVFATRSTHRPNGLGLSVGKIVSIKHSPKDETTIRVAGLDLLNGTPVVDIKPYLGWSDSVSAHESGFAQATPAKTLEVRWSETSLRQADFLKVKPTERATIEAVLALDPRPAYHASRPPRASYGVSLYRYNIRFKIDADAPICWITEVTRLSE